MRVFKAMLIDAYRELNAKKLFWVTLAISGLVMLFYASIGFNADGMYFFFGLWQIDHEFIRAGTPIADMLYRSIFSSFIVGIWLAWIAVILALISTSTVFPDFLAGGSIDLVLSKPIGRVRLFLYKYLTSLLFVLLQVGIFCVGVFLCMGLRVGDWNWLIFAAVPVITLFYSYLFSMNVLLGVWTRSALTALLITLLFWFSIFGINTAESILLNLQITHEVQIEEQESQVEEYEAALAQIEDNEDNTARRRTLQGQIDSARGQIDSSQELIDKLQPWKKRVQAVKYVLPKTGETVGLVERWLKRDTDVALMDIFEGNIAVNEEGEYVPAQSSTQRKIQMRLQDEYYSRSLWYVIGTSVVFEVVMLTIACFIFIRRDF